MRLVIDKDIPEIKLLQESWEKSKPSFKVVAVNECDRFVYAKDLNTIKEATDAVYAAYNDNTFSDCSIEIVGSAMGEEGTIWSSDDKALVSESTRFDEKFFGKDGALAKFFGAAADKMKSAFDGFKKAWGSMAEITKNFAKDKLDKFRRSKCINDKNQMTGYGFKVAQGTVKPVIGTKDGEQTDATKEELNELATDMRKMWDAIDSKTKQNLQQTKQFKSIDKVDGMVKSDKEPVQIAVNATTNEGQKVDLLLTQDGDSALNPKQTNGGDAGKGDGGKAGGGQTALGNASPEKIAQAVDKNPTQAMKTIGQQVAQNTQDIAELEKQLAAESTWNFNDEQLTNKAGIERLAIKRFFNEINDPAVKEIKFVSESGEVKTYYTNAGSSAYAAFKKDFRESTDRCAKATDLVGYKVTFESSKSKSHLKGFKFSDFGVADDFDSTSKTIVIKESVTRMSNGGDNSKETSTKKEVVKESSNEDSDARFATTTVDAKTPSANPEPSGFTLEVGELNPEDEVKSLLASMNKYDVVKPNDIQDGSISTGVTTYPDAEVVQEAEGDEEGGDDAGGDAGGDAGADADPFAGGDDADPFADDAGGGDDAGGDAGAGEDADPFAGGGPDDAGGDIGGDAGGAAGGDAGGGGDAPADAGEDDAAADPNSPEGEPAPESPVNTDAQGEPKSQYNINVTEPFNVNDDFSLNEEEQKEFFGKIDQLVKIPDMDNYSLYLYQITPENMNLDDVHYIQALYELSVKLGLLEDVYADSNLLEKYNSYKYSVVKDGEKNKDGEDFKVQEQNNPIWVGNKVMLEAKDNKEDSNKKPRGISKVQDDNEDKNKWVKDNSKEDIENKKQDDRRGPKWTKLDKDKNGADKPIVIDAAKEAWDSVNGKKDGDKEDDDKKLLDGTSEGQFHGLGWLATFKAMQFGSPRYLTLYIKRNGDEKAEKQCEDYLKRLSYTEIEFVNIDEVDPYEYVYRSCSGMKSPEQVRTEKYANEEVPVTYLENTETKVPESIPGDIKRDIKRVITKLNAEIRGTKQFNFLKECGVEKPQIDHLQFLTGYKTAQVNETLSETTYKFIFKKDDSTFSRMFYSNLKEKLFKYLGSFAQKFNLECGCEVKPTMICIDFMRSDLGNPTYDLDTMVVEPDTPAAPTLDQAMEIAKTM